MECFVKFQDNFSRPQIYVYVYYLSREILLEMVTGTLFYFRQIGKFLKQKRKIMFQ